MPVVAPPPAPAGTRDVAINAPSQDPGDFATIRTLTLNSQAGAVAVPAGTYGTFVANGPSAFVLGVAGATTPSIYNLQSLTLNSGAALQVVGPVIVTVANSVTINGTAGASGSPGLLRLEVASGGVTVNSNAVLNGSVIAPSGTVIVNGTLNGSVIADRLIVNGNGILRAQD